MLNPKLYEINTRVWIKRFGENTKLNSIPIDYFKDLADKGINIIWLMGIWKTCPSTIEKYCFETSLISAYNNSLKDWRKEDVIGSPFSIDDYEINPDLGCWEDVRQLKKKLNDLGIKLMLDFVSNHFSADTSLLNSNPEIFLEADEETLARDPFTFFKPDVLKSSSQGCKKIFAHGRDPLFPAWTDTIQINYFNEKAKNFLISNLLKITEICDGLRCDMAMLLLNNIFYNTWSSVLQKFGYKKPENEFWKTAIEKVKSKVPEFIFLAETYWDLEWILQQLGFDFTYDKRLTDRLILNDIQGVYAHLRADRSYQMKSARFLENHDERRAVVKFGKQKAIAAAVVVSTILGMKFFFDGQFEGKKTKLPVQLGREPEEKISETKRIFYNKLLEIIKSEIFIFGDWKLLEPLPISEKNLSFNNFFTWQWKYKNETRIIVVNFSDSTSQCRVHFDIDSDNENILLIDLLNNQKYTRRVDEIKNVGLFVELKSYNSHIFSIENQPAS